MKNKFFMCLLAAPVLAISFVNGNARKAAAEGEDWIKVGPNTKLVQTIDASGTVGEFAWNTGNNGMNVSVLIDLGKQADGTDEANQEYLISGLQTVNLQNATSLTVFSSLDGETFDQVYTTTDTAGEWKVHNFDEVKARYFKLSTEGEWQTYWNSEYSFAFYGKVAPQEEQEPQDDWIKITEGSKLIKTVDGDGNLGDFAYNTANNANGVSLLIDLGKKADGTDEENQEYLISGLQTANLGNATSLTIYSSLDGETFDQVYTTTDVAGEWKVHNFDAVKGRYFKLSTEGEWQTYWGAEYPVAFYGKVAPKEVQDDWIKIVPNSKYTYTVDGDGNVAPFEYNAGNNVAGKVLYVDLGMASDGVTPEKDQCYILKGAQLNTPQNFDKVTVEVSEDNITYTTVIDQQSVSSPFQILNFGEINARYIRFIPNGEAWQTIWGEEYAVAVYGKPGHMESIDTDPHGLTIGGYDSNVVYPLVKGDSLNLKASKINPKGTGDIEYTVSDTTDIFTFSESQQLTINQVGDGTTVYTISASVANPEGGNYTSTFKFVVLSEELEKVSTMYYNSDLDLYDLIDVVDVKLVRVCGEEVEVQSALDYFNYSTLEANKLLETPVRASSLKITGTNVVVYGTANSSKAPITNATYNDIDGFWPENPLENAYDGYLETKALTPKANMLGEGEVKGSITFELDGFYNISTIRLFSFWNTMNEGYFSFSSDGVNFEGEERFTTAYCSIDGIGAEFYTMVNPFDEVIAKYVRLNIVGWTSNEDSIGVREVTVYGDKVTTACTLSFNSNCTDDVSNMPTDILDAQYGDMIQAPTTTPTRTGYTFAGWYLDAACTIEATFPMMLTDDVEVYAKWVELQKFTVTVNTTGDGFVTGAPTEAVYEGTVVTLTITPAEGWLLKSVTVNGEAAQLNNGTLQLTVNGNINISVVFEEDSHDNPGPGSSSSDSESQPDSSSSTTSNPTSSSSSEENNNDEPVKSGCKGSVVASSILVSCLALAGITVIASKRKED